MSAAREWRCDGRAVRPGEPGPLRPDFAAAHADKRYGGRCGSFDGEARKEEVSGREDRKAADAEVARVKQLVAAAELRRDAADAHRDYAGKLIEARQAGEEAAKQRIELANAKLELAKFQALQQANPQAVAQYDRAKFTARVSDAQRTLDERRARA